MYLDFYGLREAPFSITPDPRFVFLSERHRDALAHLLYGIGQGGGGGFVQLTGEVGTGKTTLCRLLLEQLPDNVRVALVLNPRLTPIELLQSIAEELKIDLPGRRDSLKALVDALNAFLIDAYARGLRVVLIVDEAQNLSNEALEQIRLLTNLETATQKLLQIILLGQPELRGIVAQPELRQLSQRITARYHLLPLDEAETEAYLRHRLAVAGSAKFPFTRLAVRQLHRHSGGVPRLINTIADRALMAGYAKEQAQVGDSLVDLAAREVLASPLRRWRVPRLAWLALVLLVALVAAVWRWPAPSRVVPPPAEVAVAAAAEDELAAIEDLAELDEASRELAFTRLLAQWKLRAAEVDVAAAMRCAPTLAPGIFCLRGSGSLSKLDALGRPAVLRLDANGNERWAVLLGVGRERVRLALGGKTLDVARADLERHWLGEYYALWRAPEFLAGVTLRRGDSGPGVEWLRGRLVEGKYLQADLDGPALFDVAIEAGVRALQGDTGLLPDGIVGPETLMAVSGIGRDAPRLRRRL
ncbi:MAG TPA: AAA family ATPase [Chiayiivirga sp.]|nr:AAA family ATPase [Chiayiivirga sp.]